MSSDYVFVQKRKGGAMAIQSPVAEQIMGALQYEYAVARELLTGKSMDAWLDGAFVHVQENFGEWLDRRAMAMPKELAHVYEWNAVGSKRLFQLTKKPTERGFMVSYSFLQSRRLAPINPRLLIPGPSGKVVTRTSVFRNKAKVMESGLPVVIRPKGSNWLALPVPNARFRGKQNRRGVDQFGVGIAFSRGPVIVRNPGGPLTTGGFGRSFRTYFRSGLATKHLKYIGYMDKVGKAAKLAGEDIPTQISRMGFRGSINPTAINGWAKLRAQQAAKIYV